MDNSVLGKGRKILAVMAISLSPMMAHAGDISYSNAELGYQMMTGDGSFDGYFLRGSFQLTDQFYVAAGFDELEDSGISQEILSVRGGMKFTLEDNLDLYGELGLVKAKIEVSYSTMLGTVKDSASETGFQLEGGTRMMLSDQMEGRAYLRHVDVDGYDENFLGAQGVFYLTDQIGLHAGASRLFDASEFLIEAGARFSF